MIIRTKLSRLPLDHFLAVDICAIGGSVGDPDKDFIHGSIDQKSLQLARPQKHGGLSTLIFKCNALIPESTSVFVKKKLQLGDRPIVYSRPLSKNFKLLRRSSFSGNHSRNKGTCPGSHPRCSAEPIYLNCVSGCAVRTGAAAATRAARFEGVANTAG